MKRVIVSGYFNPLHGGHLDMIEGAKKLSDYLIVVVNNDAQQILKKGKIIMDQDTRCRIVGALRDVNEVVLSIDQDSPVTQTLETIAKKYSGDELIFANGGDRDSEKAVPETDVCHKFDIEMVFGVAGLIDSSTRINRELGQE